MRQSLFARMLPFALPITLPLACLLAAAPTFAQESFAERVAQAAVGEHRSASNRARNEFRNPVQTLQFFGFEPGMSVLEISPGGGWYLEILAPAIREHGRYVAAHWDPAVADQPGYRYRQIDGMKAKLAARPDLYDQVEVLPFSPPESASLGGANQFDRVLTFRNTHGWVRSGMAPDLFREFARVLKPGGVLGLVQHRAAPGSDASVAASGYVPEDLVKQLAAEAGLEFVSASEVNANPLDSRQHPEGVWTLPPSLRLGEQDREAYLAIGESDRMTLKFRKPVDG